MNTSMKSSKQLSTAVTYIVLILGSVVMIFPFVWMLLTSFKTQAESMAIPPQILPSHWDLANFTTALTSLPFVNLYVNTGLLILFRVLCAVVFSSMAGYAFAKLEFPCKNLLFGIVLVQMMLPSQIFITPQYLMLARMGLTNSIFALVFPGLVSAFGTFFLRQTYLGIPNEIAEAAYLDGCSTTRLFLQIVLPLSTPIIAVLVLFYAVGHWNNYFNALIYLSKAEHYPLQLYLRNVLILEDVSALMGDTEAVQEWLERLERKEAMKFGVVVVSSVPVLVLYPFLQKYFVKGMTIGAIKG